MNKRLIAIQGTTLIGVYSATIIGVKIMMHKLDELYRGVTNDNQVEIYTTSSMLVELGFYNESCNIIRTSDTRAVIEFKDMVIKCKRII